MMELSERCYAYINYVGVPVTEFCRRVDIAPSTFYRWQRQEIELSEQTQARIAAYLDRMEVRGV